MIQHNKLFGHEFKKDLYSYYSETCYLLFDYNAISPVDTCLIRIYNLDGYTNCLGTLQVTSNSFKEIKDQQEKIMDFILKYIEEERKEYYEKRERVNVILNGLDIFI